MTLPYLRFFYATNPHYNVPIERVDPISFETWQMLVATEPSKINRDYDEFNKQYIERETDRRQKLAKCPLLILKVPVCDDHPESMNVIESREDFIKWVV